MNNDIIQFKHDWLKEQFNNPNLENRLRVILYSLAGYVYNTLHKEIIITEIYRTQEMQDEYYKDDFKYKIQKWVSVHQFWRGIDISLKYFTTEEIKLIENYLLQFQYDEAGLRHTGVFHEVNAELGFHLHLQVSNENYTKII